MNIQAIMQKKNLTMAELASLTNRDRSHLQRILRGERPAGRELAKRLSALLGIERSVFLYPEEYK